MALSARAKAAPKAKARAKAAPRRAAMRVAMRVGRSRVPLPMRVAMRAAMRVPMRRVGGSRVPMRRVMKSMKKSTSSAAQNEAYKKYMNEEITAYFDVERQKWIGWQTTRTQLKKGMCPKMVKYSKIANKMVGLKNIDGYVDWAH